jgi:branched-chain amino acid transport system ATP-binding protein
MTLTVTNLSVTDSSRTLVAGVSLTVVPGQVTAVIGANGAGKSELVLALAGVLPISTGEISLDG